MVGVRIFYSHFEVGLGSGMNGGLFLINVLKNVTRSKNGMLEIDF